MSFELKLLIFVGVLVGLVCLLTWWALSLHDKLGERRAEFLALGEHYRAQEKEIVDLKKTIRTEKANSQNAEGKLDDAKKKLLLAGNRESWCDPKFLEFPPGVPEPLHKSTLVHARYVLNEKLGSFYDLRGRSSFRAPGQWELYWCLAHASKAAIASATVKMEDGITADFVRALEVEAKRLPTMIEEVLPSLQLAYSKIFEQAKPAMKEADVGADVLLIVAGDNLTPDGGARLFWIQAKKARSGGPYMLDCSHKNTSDSQIDALKKVDIPALGSFAIYCQYSSALTFIPSFALTSHKPSADLKVDLAEHGVRIAELVTAFSAYQNPAITSFSDATAVTAFIGSISTGKPLYVVAATESEDQYLQKWNAHTLVKQIEQHYERELGMDRDLPQERGLDDGQELTM